MANEIDFHPAYAVQPSLAITFGAKGGVPTFVSADNPFPVVVIGGGGGGGGATTEYTEDAAAPANPIGGTMLLRRRDALSASEVGADGDFIAVNATSKGEMVTHDSDVLAQLQAIKVQAEDTTTASPVKPGDATVRGAQYGLGIDASTELTIPSGTKFAWVQAEGQNARWRHDGETTEPTASSGARIIKDQPPVLIPVAMLTSARFIGEASGGKLNIIYAS